jgi:hypothetical protein
MRIVELIIDEQDDQSGIDAISVVMSPAIESNFIHLSKHEVVLKEIDAEKRILMGAALIPDKQIYRRNDKTKDEYYIYFSKATIRKASELFLMNANQNNSTLEHSQKLKGMSVVESWIIEGENDKSKNYGFDLPQGTWMISMKVNNDEIWDKVKLGEVKGFSIEGYFADRYEMNSKNIDMEEKAMVEKIKELITKSELKTNKVDLASVKELSSQLKVLQGLESELVKSAEKYMAILTTFEKQYQVANGVRNSANRAVGDSLAMIKDFKSKASALGLDGSNVKEVVDLDSMIKKTLANQKDFDANIRKPL